MTEEPQYYSQLKLDWDALNNAPDIYTKEVWLKRLLDHTPNDILRQQYIDLVINDTHVITHDMTKDFAYLKILELGLRTTFSKIRDIRHKRIVSHASAHACASGIRKSLELFQQFNWSDDFLLQGCPRIFDNYYQKLLKEIQTEFGPIHDVLTAGITFRDDRREQYEESKLPTIHKHTKNFLLRLIFDRFEQLMEEFLYIDWEKEYTEFYKSLLEYYKKLKVDLNE